MTATATAAAPPAVFASGDDLRCGEKNESASVRCDRPFGHQGGHLTRPGVYWQAKCQYCEIEPATEGDFCEACAPAVLMATGTLDASKTGAAS